MEVYIKLKNLTELTDTSIAGLSSQWSLSPAQADMEHWNFVTAGILEISKILVAAIPLQYWVVLMRLV